MSDILTFFRQLRDNKEAAKINEKLEKSVDYFSRQGIYTFYLASKFEAPGITILGGMGVSPLIALDSEDITYFVNKYSTRIQKELDTKINSVQKEYEDIINMED